jgi:hypothetical protein
MQRIARVRPLVLALLVLCAAATAGCDPEFQAPLSDAQTSKVDEQLLGTWYFAGDATPSEEESPPLKIVRQDKSNALKLDWGPPRRANKKHGNEKLPGEVFTTKAGGRRFMSMVAALPNGKDGEREQPTRYDVFAYRTRGESLEVFMLDASAIGDAIQAGKLRGSAKERRGLLVSGYTSVLVTDTPKNALEFLAANFDACVAHDQTFRFTRTPPARPKRKEQAKAADSVPQKFDFTALPKARPDEISQRLVGTWTTRKMYWPNLMSRSTDPGTPWLLDGRAQVDLRPDGTMVLSWIVNDLALLVEIRNWRVPKTKGNRETVAIISKAGEQKDRFMGEWAVTMLSDRSARVEDRKGRYPPFILTKCQ